MSRIGRLPITVPSGVKAEINGQDVTITGPKGTLSITVSEPITVSLEDATIVVRRPNDERRNRALHGLTRSLINNMVIGVTEGYTKKMEISGTGYRVLPKGKDLEFQLGYSHPVPVIAPEGITFAVEGPLKFSISGIDKQKVGEVAANIRKIRKLDPYKGKGVRYANEVVIIKETKKK